MLTITLPSVKLLCGFTDTSQDAGILALIALQQPAWEYAVDPAVLAHGAADAGLAAVLTLGVTEALAGGYLGALGRGLVSQGLLAAQALNAAVLGLVTDDAGGTAFLQQTFRVSTLEISTKPLFDNFRPEVTKADLVRLGADLAAGGLARLAPFLRSAQALARTASGGDARLDDQSPVPLLLGAGLGGGLPPADATFDAVLGTDGHAAPTGAGEAAFPFFGSFDGGAR